MTEDIKKTEMNDEIKGKELTDEEVEAVDGGIQNTDLMLHRYQKKKKAEQN